MAATPLPGPFNPASATTTPPPFPFPKSHAFPPLYSLQPNLTTRRAQILKWSRHIQLYCRHHRFYRLSLPSCLDLDLFRNQEIRKRLGEKEVREVVGFMCSEEGGRRAEWIGGREGVGSAGFWVFWKRPEEWGEEIARWVEETGQKGAVLTFYELLNGDGTRGQGFHGMDAELFQRALGVLVKKGKAQVFGEEDSRGVKFF